MQLGFSEKGNIKGTKESWGASGIKKFLTKQRLGISFLKSLQTCLNIGIVAVARLVLGFLDHIKINQIVTLVEGNLKSINHCRIGMAHTYRDGSSLFMMFMCVGMLLVPSITSNGLGRRPANSDLMYCSWCLSCEPDVSQHRLTFARARKRWKENDTTPYQHRH